MTDEAFELIKRNTERSDHIFSVRNLFFSLEHIVKELQKTSEELRLYRDCYRDKYRELIQEIYEEEKRNKEEKL